MIKVTLHGPLAEFGKVWRLDVSTPAEAVRAINGAKPGFKDSVLGLTSAGYVFRVRTESGDHSDASFCARISGNRLDFIPVVQASNAGTRFVVGAVLLAAANSTGVGAALSPAIVSAMAGSGAGLMLGSIAEWLTPKIKSEATERSNSWSVSGAGATIGSGSAIPVIYGEVLTPGHPISLGTQALKVSTSGAIDPAVNIGGEVAVTASFGGAPGLKYVVLHYTAAPFNMLDPLTYSWANGGFLGSASVEVLPSAPGAYTLKVGYGLAPEDVMRTEALITVTATGKASLDGTVRTVSTSLPILVTVDNYNPWAVQVGSQGE